MLEDTGFGEVTIGPAVDTFDGALGQENARAYEVYGYAFLARKPPTESIVVHPARDDGCHACGDR